MKSKYSIKFYCNDYFYTFFQNVTFNTKIFSIFLIIVT